MADYEMVHFPPSQVASAAFALTLKVFNCGEWVSWPLGHRALVCLPVLWPLKCRRIEAPHWLEGGHFVVFATLLLSRDLIGLSFSQNVTLQHYMNYTEDTLIPVMQHIAKNVVKVNEGLTKHMVS